MKDILILISIFCMVFSAAFSQTANNLPGNWQIVWSDEFNYIGLPDSSKWDYDTGGSGWGNNELQYYTRSDTSNAIVRVGLLHIIALNIE